MPAGAKLHTSGKIIEIWSPTGVFSADSMRRSTVDAFQLSQDTGIECFLMDSTQLKFVENLLEVSKLPALYEQLGVSQEVRVAVVKPVSEVTRRSVDLYIASCKAAGWEVQQLDSRKEAVDWLLS